MNEQQVEKLRDWQLFLNSRRFRGLLHIQGDETWAFARAKDCLSHLNLDAVTVGGEAVRGIDFNRVKSVLGTDQQAVIFNAYSGFHANAFALIAGTIKSGGILIIISPEHQQWPSFADPDLQRYQCAGDKPIGESLFIKRLSSLLQQKCIVSISKNSNNDCYQFPDLAFLEAQHLANSLDSVFVEQKQLITQIKQVVTGHAKRPLLIMADRGRGKSSAIGLALQELLQQRDYHVVVTAPFRGAVDNLFYHFENTCSEIAMHEKASLTFMPIDAVIQNKPKADLLIVDEAAAIPSFLLASLLEHFNRIVFSTTTQGYEGNGQGFLLRFADTLDKAMPQWRKATLNQAIRYSNNDLLESFLSQLFVLNGELEDIHFVEKNASLIDYQIIDREYLRANEPLLRQIFTLLISAHYQTSADDLRVLLDMPKLHICVAMWDGRIIAVAMVVIEGELTQDQQQELQHGSRRFRGHILPQQCFALGFEQALGLRFARVMRIAVHPSCWRQGIGKALLVFIEKNIKADFFGASFALEADVLRFWQQSEFKAVQLGSKKESSSGSFSSVVLKPQHAQAELLLGNLRDSLIRNLPYQLQTFNSDLSEEVAGLLFYQLDFSNLNTKQFKSLLQKYLNQEVGLETVQAVLAQLLIARLSRNRYQQGMAGDITIALLLQGKSFVSLAKQYPLAGRKAVEQQLRIFLTDLISKE